MNANNNPDAPVRTFHETRFFISDLFLHALITAMAAVPLLGLPIQWLFKPHAWPPHGALFLIWLAGSGGLVWFVVAPMVATWQRVRQGDKAGLSIAEGDDHLEVAFWAGGRAWRVRRFPYAVITGCGTDRFQISPFGRYETRPFVAMRGMVRDSVKVPLFLAIQQDARSLRSDRSHDIAADLEKIIGRHCPLAPRRWSGGAGPTDGGAGD